MLKKTLRLALLLLISICFGEDILETSKQSRDVPRELNYQGYLTDTLGVPITDDLSMTFKIFDRESGGNELWSETQCDDVPIESGVFNVILGETTPIPDSVFTGFTSTWLELTLDGSQTLTPRTRITSVGYAYTSTYSDTAEYAKNAAGDNDWTLSGNVLYPAGSYGLSMRHGNMMHGIHDSTHVNFGVACTTGTSHENYKYCAVGGGRQNTAGASNATVGGGYYNTASGINATVGGGRNNAATHNYTVVCGGSDNYASGNTATIGGGYYNYNAGDYSVICGGYADTIATDAHYSYLFGIGSNLTEDSTFMVDMPHIRFGDETNGYEFPTSDGTNGQVMATDGSGSLSWSSASGGDNDWTYRVTDGNDTTLITGGEWGIARSGNTLYGNADSTHVNLGVACTTGMSGQNYKYCTVGGGYWNTASSSYATVGGGVRNKAIAQSATVGGGDRNIADGAWATVAGGTINIASSSNATVGGGYENTASYYCATVGGGISNTASHEYATVGGGKYNTASGWYATVAGGALNTASSNYATVGGGMYNTASWYATVGGGMWNIASGDHATVAGGYEDTAAAYCSFATNYSTKVNASDTNSAAFTTSHTITDNQVRAAAFSTGTLVFTMDHPSDPMNKILNQHAIGSSEAMLIYSGSIVLDANGRATVDLPDYFDDINKNPRIQLTGVGTSDVYVAEDITGNSFIVGGKPNTKVYWEVTGERTDIHAEIARIQTPVEQQKTGDLVGHSLDDDALIGIYDGLRQKKQGYFKFRTEEGRRVHEQTKQVMGE